MSDAVKAADVAAMCDRIAPILAGHPPPVQGAVLADLLAMWLAGFIEPDNAESTNELRERLLQFHLDHVRRLIPINAAALHGEDAP